MTRPQFPGAPHRPPKQPAVFAPRIEPSTNTPGLLGVPATATMWTASAIAIHRVALPPGSGHVILDDAASSSIALNRNKIVATLLAHPAMQWLLFCDSDMVPPADTALRLLAHGEDKEIVSAMCFARTPPHLPAWAELADAPATMCEEGLREIDIAGFGCVLVRRRVFETMPPPWFEHPTPGCGEDMVFGRKARALGFRFFLDPTVDVGHMAALPINRDRALAWQSCAAGAAQVASASARGPSPTQREAMARTDHLVREATGSSSAGTTTNGL